MYLFLTLCSLMLFFSFAVYSLSLLFSTSARTTFLLRKLVPSEVSYLQFLLISVHIFYFHLLSSLTHAFGVSWRQYFIEFCTFIHIGNLCPVCLCVPVHLCTHVATHVCAGIYACESQRTILRCSQESSPCLGADSLMMDLELAKAGLASQWAPGICVRLLSTWIISLCHHTWLRHLIWLCLQHMKVKVKENLAFFRSSLSRPSLYFLTAVFRPFASKLAIDIIEFTSSIFDTVFYLFLFLIFLFFLQTFSSFVTTEHFIWFHLLSFLTYKSIPPFTLFFFVLFLNGCPRICTMYYKQSRSIVMPHPHCIDASSHNPIAGVLNKN